MPVHVTYPGVYIEEIPSGQHTVTGVATSITAFVGRAVCGPTDEPMTIFSFGDYERTFGGLAYDYPMSYAVKDFFLNGGSQAVIARLFKANDTSTTGQAIFKVDTLYGQTNKITIDKNDPTKGTIALKDVNVKPVNGDTFTIGDDKKNVYIVDGDVADSKVIPFKCGEEIPEDIINKKGQNAYLNLDSLYGKIKKITIDDNPKTGTIELENVVKTPVENDPFIIGTDTNIIYKVVNYENADKKTIHFSLMDGTVDIPKDINNKAGQNAYLNTLYGKIKKITIANDSKTGTIELDNVVKTPAVNDPFIIGTDMGTIYKVGSYTENTKTINFSLLARNIPTDVILQRGQNAYKKESAPILLKSANPGAWGNNICAATDTVGIDDQVVQLYKKYGLTKDDLFNLTVIYFKTDGTTASERFTNVTMAEGKTSAPNYLKDVLASQSLLVRVPGTGETATKGYDSGSLDETAYIGSEDSKTGMYMLKKVDLFNLLCIPPDQRGSNTAAAVYTEALNFCVARRAMLIVDPPISWANNAKTGKITDLSPTDDELGINGPNARNAAVYFPRVIKQDLEMGNQPAVFPACGIIAGVMAATDVARGVWKAPAGQNAAIMGIMGLEVNLTDDENGVLNPLGINCLRNFPIIGPVVWGARTLRGADQLSDDYKYVPVRRLTMYIEESVYRGSQWAVFEPNDEKLWSSLRLSIGTFLADLQRQGAFYNYTVACDSSTTTQYDIDRGIVNIYVGIAPVKPAEFVVIQIQQLAGQKAA
jgi:hypothetical protein